MPGRLQIGVDQPLRLGGGFDIAHLIPLPLHPQIRHALPADGCRPLSAYRAPRSAGRDRAASPGWPGPVCLSACLRAGPPAASAPGDHRALASRRRGSSSAAASRPARGYAARRCGRRDTHRATTAPPACAGWCRWPVLPTSCSRQAITWARVTSRNSSGLPQAGEGHESRECPAVGPARIGVGQVGKPFDLGWHVGTRARGSLPGVSPCLSL